MTRFLHRSSEVRTVSGCLLAHRPPIESSVIEVTAASMHALQIYGRRHGAERPTRAIRGAAAWIAKAQPETNEDRAFRPAGPRVGRASQATPCRAAARALAGRRSVLTAAGRSCRRSTSDAYATGQALVALIASGAIPRD